MDSAEKWKLFDLHNAVLKLMDLTDSDFESEFNNLIQFLLTNRKKAFSLLDKYAASLSPKGFRRIFQMAMVEIEHTEYSYFSYIKGKKRLTESMGRVWTDAERKKAEEEAIRSRKESADEESKAKAEMEQKLARQIRMIQRIRKALMASV